MYKKKFKNEQDVFWLEHDYMEMKMIVTDQSKNYFHLSPKIGPLWGGGGRVPGLPKLFGEFFFIRGGFFLIMGTIDGIPGVLFVIFLQFIRFSLEKKTFIVLHLEHQYSLHSTRFSKGKLNSLFNVFAY